MGTNDKMYHMTMVVAIKLYEENVITKDELDKFNILMTRKYSPLFEAI